MQSSVAAIRGGRIRPRFVRPSSHDRLRRLGLSHMTLGRMVTAPRPYDADRPVALGLGSRTGHSSAAARPVRIAALRREARMTWMHPFVTLRRGSVVDPAAPWRG